MIPHVRGGNGLGEKTVLTNDGIRKDPKTQTVTHIQRDYVKEDGSIGAECVLRPAALPMDFFDAEALERIIWLRALKTTRNSIIKGAAYRLSKVHRTGFITVRDEYGQEVYDMFPMSSFVQMLEQEHQFPTNVPTENTLETAPRKKASS